MTSPDVKAPPVQTNGWSQKEILQHMWGELRDLGEKVDVHLIHASSQDEKLSQVESRMDRLWAFILGFPSILALGFAVFLWWTGA